MNEKPVVIVWVLYTWFRMFLLMITRPIWKCPCIKLFITYFRHLEKKHPYWPEMKSGPIWASIWKWSCSNPITGYFPGLIIILVLLNMFTVCFLQQLLTKKTVINFEINKPEFEHLLYRYVMSRILHILEIFFGRIK
jgi:hypothetical protein